MLLDICGGGDAWIVWLGGRWVDGMRWWCWSFPRYISVSFSLSPLVPLVLLLSLVMRVIRAVGEVTDPWTDRGIITTRLVHPSHETIQPNPSYLLHPVNTVAFQPTSPSDTLTHMQPPKTHRKTPLVATAAHHHPKSVLPPQSYYRAPSHSNIPLHPLPSPLKRPRAHRVNHKSRGAQSAPRTLTRTPAYSLRAVALKRTRYLTAYPRSHAILPPSSVFA